MPVFFRSIFITLLMLKSVLLTAQQSAPFIRLVNPLKESNEVSAARNFIIGSTCKTCRVMINNILVKVYPTGAFVQELNLKEGDSLFLIQSNTPEGKMVSKKLQYLYRKTAEAKAVTEFAMASIRTFPEGNLVLKPGDIINFRVKALTGCTVEWPGKMRLYELPALQTEGIAGIYQGSYAIKETDSFSRFQVPLTLIDSSGKKIQKSADAYFSVISALASDIGITKGRLAHLEYGLGDDRLGGAKMGYIDSLIRLKITGKFGNKYRVQLAPSRIAYIPEEHVELMPKGTFGPSSLTGKWRISGYSAFDKLEVQFFQRLPYQVKLLTNPSRIEVDVFGATNNTNWIDQTNTAKEITRATYEQVADDIFRITIFLKHQQHWGQEIYYDKNQLVVKVRHQPEELSLKHLTIAVDAGHGGSNTGAVGPTGITEKELTLSVALKLQKLLSSKGAKVIMTRNKETFFDNKERILFYRDSLPDLLVSIHLNSSTDPIRAKGTATFYRYDAFRPLSKSIYEEMIQLGMPEYGNNGSFNFMLNSPVEYPNALIEALFLSNPEEEMLILDESFQQRLAEKIVKGIEAFLENCKQDK